MKETLQHYFNTFFHTIADFFSIGEKIVIPWVLTQFKDKELLEIGAKLTYYYFAIFLFFSGGKYLLYFLSLLMKLEIFLLAFSVLLLLGG